MAQSKSEIDQLGETLKLAPVSEASLIALDQFRLTFGASIDQVRRALNEQCGVQCSLRPSKSTPSIIAKLIRQPTLRLTQIQDIAGLRVIVKDYAEQDVLRDKVIGLYPDCKIYDRREKPSYGYRAVHLVMKVDGRLVELQIRTEFQHAWAQVLEKLADVYGHEIKYMPTNYIFSNALSDMSDNIHLMEQNIALMYKKLVTQPSMSIIEKTHANKLIVEAKNLSNSSISLLKEIALDFTK